MSAVCPANTAVSSITTEVAHADTFTMGVAIKSTPIKDNSKSSAKTIKTLRKGAQVEIFSSRNGYYYVGYGRPNTASAGLGWVKCSDLQVHTCYR